MTRVESLLQILGNVMEAREELEKAEEMLIKEIAEEKAPNP